MARLESIPKELQLSIVKYVTMNEDKKNLCLTYKNLQGLVTPLLYRDMVISPKQLSEAFEATLTAGHPGIPHIRTLRVDTENCSADMGRKFGTERIARLHRLIFAIPRDVLTHFELPFCNDIDYSLDLLIRTRQSNVRNRQYHSPAWRDPPYVGPRTQEPANITCLQLYLQDLDDCDRASVLIDLNQGIKSLAVEFDRRLRRMDFVFDTGHPSPTEVIGRLFATSATSNKPRVGLESLRITDFPLEILAEVLPTKFAMQDLKQVQLIRCSFTGRFIQMLSEFGVDLVSYTLSSVQDELCIRGLNEELVSLMTAPERLLMSSSYGDILCGWPALIPRAASLKCLKFVDAYLEYEDPVVHEGTEGFLAFCEAASSLEQLAITCPSIETTLWDATDGFISFLDCEHVLKLAPCSN